MINKTISKYLDKTFFTPYNYGILILTAVIWLSINGMLCMNYYSTGLAGYDLGFILIEYTKHLSLAAIIVGAVVTKGVNIAKLGISLYLLSLLVMPLSRLFPIWIRLTSTYILEPLSIFLLLLIIKELITLLNSKE